MLQKELHVFYYPFYRAFRPIDFFCRSRYRHRLA